MIKIERDKLATLVSLAEGSIKGNLGSLKGYRLLEIIKYMKEHIKEYDKKEEEKIIGKFYKQQNLF